MSRAILLVDCPDQVGIIATTTNYLQYHKGNILDLEQHVDDSTGHFFMRLEWELSGFDIPQDRILEFFRNEIGNRYQMNVELYFADVQPTMAIFCSKMSHCLYDILYRIQSSEWSVHVPLIISNHPDLKYIADRFEISYHHIPISKATKLEQEKRQIELLRENNVDLIVLARYMQILSSQVVEAYPNQIINIHHSFLPAFAGAKPYHAAFKRGVKIIGATSHYVTNELDEGPIIEQDVVHISHTDGIRDLIRKGKDLEKIVLSNAVRHHIERKVLVRENKTVVFN
ncbi:MAG: formyltetrahydrofolate deformylase [Bacteroidia bacterium]|nr:formyltetrahydrofolate deformylase [Bacteroidia bacterium]